MKRRLLVASGLVLVLVAVAVCAGGAYAYFRDRSQADVIANGVQVAGVQVGGLRAAAARQLLTRELVTPLAQPLRIDAGSWTTTVERTQAGIHVDVDGMVAQAVASSRHAPLARRLLREWRGQPLDESIPLRARVSTAKLAGVLDEVSAEVNRPAVPAHVVPTARRLRIVPSSDGVEVDAARFRSALRRALLDPSVSTLTVPLKTLRPKATTARLAKRYPSFLLVDRETYTLRLFRHLKLAKVFPVSVGQQGLETPAGLYHINDRQTDPSWHVPLSAWAGSLAGKVIPPGPADPIKARWLGFFDGAGIHGTDETWSIGHAASHGCVRMRIPDVIALYPLVPLGTPIYVG